MINQYFYLLDVDQVVQRKNVRKISKENPKSGPTL